MTLTEEGWANTAPGHQKAENQGQAAYFRRQGGKIRPPMPVDPSGEGGEAAHAAAVSMVPSLAEMETGPSDHHLSISVLLIVGIGYLPP